MRLITLIQTRPQEFKLDGASKLRFNVDLSDTGRRIAGVRGVLDQLLAMQ